MFASCFLILIGLSELFKIKLPWLEFQSRTTEITFFAGAMAIAVIYPAIVFLMEMYDDYTLWLKRETEASNSDAVNLFLVQCATTEEWIRISAHSQYEESAKRTHLESCYAEANRKIKELIDNIEKSKSKLALKQLIKYVLIDFSVPIFLAALALYKGGQFIPGFVQALFNAS